MQMAYSIRPHQVPFISAKDKKLRSQFIQAHQNWTAEDGKKVAWADVSQSLSVCDTEKLSS